MCLQVEANPDVDPGAVFVRAKSTSNRNICRDIGGVVAVIDRLFVAFPVPLVVSLLLLVEMVVVIRVGLCRRAGTDTNHDNQKRCSAAALRRWVSDMADQWTERNLSNLDFKTLSVFWPNVTECISGLQYY